MPRVKLFNEQNIIYKAMELFWEKGYYDTSIANMVSSLGISRGSMYDTFGNKKNIFDKSLALYCEINEKSTKEFLENETNVKEGLKKIFDKFIENSINDTMHKGCFVVNTTTEIGSNDKEVYKALLSHKANVESLFYNFLLRGQESGEISRDKDIRTFSYLIYTLFNGIRVVSKLEQDKHKLIKSVESVLSLLN